MKKYSIVFTIALAVLVITARAFCYQAEVTDISGVKYFPAVKEAIAKARKSITVAMFTVESSITRPDSKPNQLIDALIEAKNRGVEVEVILDQNVDFVRSTVTDWRTYRPMREANKIKSTAAYKRLRAAGVKVFYDEPARYTHAKAVVIDNKIVIVGSTNWTAAAFDNNIETAVLAVSGQLAEEISGYLKTIKIDYEADKYIKTIGPATPVGWELLENPKVAPLMLKAHSERAFDLYLYLLWRFDGNSEGKLRVFYNEVSKYLGIYDGWTNESYRRQIIKAFRKLERQYKLIKFESRYAQEATITLLQFQHPDAVYQITQEDYFELPDDYFNFGWNRELSFRAKFCYLVNLAYSDISDIKPFWSKSLNTITRQCGNVSRDVVYTGMGELRRKKLLEVRYDELYGKLYEARRPKMYKLLKLYDPKELELKLKAVEDSYGRGQYAKAREYAGIVFEENNPEVIEDIILKMKEYGEKEVKRVFAEVARKNIDNPKRTYLYVTRIIGVLCR